MKIRIFVFCALLVMGFSSPLQAEVLTFDATARGWLGDDGSENGTTPTNNYLAGMCAGCGSLEYRNHFEFLPSFDGNIVSARLIINTVDYQSENATETYQVTSLPTGFFCFPDLGTGTLYGSRVYSASDGYLELPIALNQDAIAAIVTGQAFRVGGRVSTLSGQLVAEEVLFAYSSLPEYATRLEITTDIRTSPVPSLNQWGLLILCALLLALGGFSLRRRMG